MERRCATVDAAKAAKTRKDFMVLDMNEDICTDCGETNRTFYDIYTKTVFR